MDAVERARWLAVSPPVAVDGPARSGKAPSFASLALIDLAFHVQGIAVVTLRGEHDVSGSRRLAEALAAAEPQLDVLVDLSHCSFIDSSVIAALVLAHERLVARGGRLELLIPGERAAIRRSAEVAGLAARVPISDTLSAALTRFEPLGAN